MQQPAILNMVSHAQEFQQLKVSQPTAAAVN